MDRIKPVAFAFKQDWARFNSDNQECRLLPHFYWGKNLAEDDHYEPLYDQGAIEDLRADAIRYRYLRQQHWNDSNLFVISGSKSLVRLGTDCPSLDRLDEAIDEAMKSGDSP